MFHRAKPVMTEPKPTDQQTSGPETETSDLKPAVSLEKEKGTEKETVQNVQSDSPQQTDQPFKQTETSTMNDQTNNTQETSTENTQGMSMGQTPQSQGFQRVGGPVPAATMSSAGRVGVPGSNVGAQNPVASQPSRSGMYSTQNDHGRHLVIGEGITITGTIESCDHLTIEGTVEAALHGARILEVAENGVFYGAVEIEEATISGTFEGDLTVNGRLTVTENGSLTGNIVYKELAIEAGATVYGTIKPIGAADVASVSTTDSKEKKTIKPANKNSGQTAVKKDVGTELPFTDRSAVNS